MNYLKFKLNLSFVLIFLMTILIVFVPVIPTISHSGRTDACGGHTNSKTGIYHYHGVNKCADSGTSN